jgi:hypothetical protein
MLIALMAPRPVYVATAEKDLWGDPKGSFLALKHAEEGYAFYGIKPMPVATQPPVNTSVIQSHLGYHMLEGAHNKTIDDWNQYVALANYRFNRITFKVFSGTYRIP